MTVSLAPIARRPSLLYWLWLAWMVVFWLISVAAVSKGLNLSLRGRLVGGVGINLFVAVFLIAALAMSTSLLITTWKVRRTGDPGIWSLVRQSRPADPVLAAVWFWARLTVGAWIVMAVLMLLFFILGRSGVVNGVTS